MAKRRAILLKMIGALMGVFLPVIAHAEERFPPPEFRSGYVMPEDTYPAPAAQFWNYLDTGLLAVALAVGVWLAIYKRSRAGILALTLFAVVWFGFVRKGCVCPIGAIQNVTEAGVAGTGIPWTVAVFFALPLIVAIGFGRAFCGGVCPLGAIQDLFVWRKWQVPGWVDASVGLLAYLYLGLAVMYAAVAGPYLICEYDPFVPMFRLSGPSYIFVIGGSLLALGLFVGRPYCRFLCPYGVLLRLCSRGSWRKVRITPSECTKCRLCEKSCPFGAIRLPTHDARPRPTLAGKGVLITMLLLAPLITAAAAGLGYASADRLALLHRDVQLAREIEAWENNPELTSDALDAFIATSEPPADLYARVATLRGKFQLGATLVGVWMGVVISSKLIAFSVRRRREDYTADPGACLACGRCFNDCPVELQRKGLIKELPVVQIGVPQ